MEQIADDESKARFLSEATALITEWWHESGGGRDCPAFTQDDNLFDLGLIDSLSLIELIAFTEQFGKVEIDLTKVDPVSVMTLRGLSSNLS